MFDTYQALLRPMCKVFGFEKKTKMFWWPYQNVGMRFLENGGGPWRLWSTWRALRKDGFLFRKWKVYSKFFPFFKAVIQNLLSFFNEDMEMLISIKKTFYKSEPRAFYHTSYGWILPFSPLGVVCECIKCTHKALSLAIYLVRLREAERGRRPDDEYAN